MLEVENRGTGFIGELGDGWSITATTSPIVSGGGPGRLGSASFSARCDKTTKFTIDNYLSVRHYLPDGTTRWLSTFDGYVRSVDPRPNGFADFEMISRLSALDVERTAKPNAMGTYQRSMRLPSQIAYDIAGTTYYTGGSYTTVSGQQVWVERPITIYDIAARNDFIYVLASGGHNGEVIFSFYADGAFREVWPVYSDATDLANPQSRRIAAGASKIFVGQQGADRVKVFTDLGAFDFQFGSGGTADGQFTTISGVACSEFFNSVFVLDSAAGRVQRFNYAGVYQNKWGTPGTVGGNTVFNFPSSIAVDPVTENVLIADQHGRIRAYDSFGNIQGAAIGSKTSLDLIGESPIPKGIGVGVAVDVAGFVYGYQNGRVWMAARDHTGFYDVYTREVGTWSAKNLERATYVNPIIAADVFSGQVYLAQATNVIEQYAGTPGTLVAVFNYYIALAVGDFPMRALSIVNPHPLGSPVPYRGWTGNVWEMLCDLAAITDVGIVTFDNQLFLINRTDRSFQLPEDVAVQAHPIDSRGIGQYVQVTNQRARWSADTAEVVYSSLADDRRDFSVDLNGFAYYTVEQDTHPAVVFNPRCANVASPGRYTIFNNQNIPITQEEWENAGGRVEAFVGTKPGTILIKVTGPGELPGGKEGPYRFVEEGGDPSLTVTGYGVHTMPEVLTVGTGVSEEVSNNQIVTTLDSPFVIDAKIAYTEASWMAYNSGTPHQRVTLRISTQRTLPWITSGGFGGTFQFINSTFYYEDSEYVVDAMTYTENQIVLEGRRYNRAGHGAAPGELTARFEEMWNAKPTSEFEGFWDGYTAQDFNMAPLRNPYGHNARTL